MQPQTARELVLQSAIRAFARQGYEATSVQEILQATDLSKPTLYYYFTSKAGLFRAILDHAYDQSYQEMQAAVGHAHGCEARLVAIADALFRFSETNRDLTRLAFAATFAGPDELPPEAADLERRKRNFHFVLGVIRDGLATRELSAEYDPVELTHGIFGAISHQIRTHLLSPAEPLDHRRAQRVVTLYLRGARHSPAPSS